MADLHISWEEYNKKITNDSVDLLFTGQDEYFDFELFIWF